MLLLLLLPVQLLPGREETTQKLVLFFCLQALKEKGYLEVKTR